MARMAVIALAAAIIGGGIVYGVMLYLERSPVQVDVQVRSVTATPVLASQTPPIPAPLPTDTPLPTVTPYPTDTQAPSVTPTPTPAPTPTPPTEREIVVNAFAECNGQYSGWGKKHRAYGASSAIEEGRQTVADIRALVERYCDGVFPELMAAAAAAQPTSTPSLPTATAPPRPTYTPRPTATRRPTPAPVPTDTPQPALAASPDLRHLEQKRYMLELINAERKKAGVGTVTLGDNIAAQLHAETALDNCFSSHWGIDGLKPYMRYSLAGGYQSNGENGSGLDYCIKASDGYRANGPIEQEIREAMDGWMNSPGHRRNILVPTHRKVSIGIAWDRYNTAMYQHFEGDYVEYDRLPAIANGILSLSGKTRNGARFDQERDLGMQIYHDPPPHALTRGQAARTYCYDNGRQVASLRWPLTGGYRWTTDTYTTTYDPCPSPYDVPADAPAPRSPAEAHQAWQQAYDASQSRPTHSITVPWITASEWTARGTTFAVKADIGSVLNQHGAGVYSLMLWGKVGGEDIVISEYSIFHGVAPPDTYNAAAP